MKGWHELGENEKVLRIMDRACIVMKQWQGQTVSGRSVLLQMKFCYE